MKTWRHRPEERPTFRHCLDVVENLQGYLEVASILSPAFNSASMNGNSNLFFLRCMYSNRLHLPAFIAIMKQFLFGKIQKKIKTLHQYVSFSRRNFQSILSPRRRKSQSQQRFVLFRFPLSHASSLKSAFDLAIDPISLHDLTRFRSFLQICLNTKTSRCQSRSSSARTTNAEERRECRIISK